MSYDSATAIGKVGEHLKCTNASLYDLVFKSECWHTRLQAQPQVVAAIVKAVSESVTNQASTTPKAVDWRNRTYQLSCDDIVSKPVDVTVHDGSATVNGAGLGSYDHWNVQVQAVQSGTVKGITDPVTVVMFTCSPQPSNFSLQEVQTFHPDGSYLARLRHLDPLPGSPPLTPVYDPVKLAVAGGEVVTGVFYYGPSDSHAGGPTVPATLRWHWDGHQFVPSGFPAPGRETPPSQPPVQQPSPPASKASPPPQQPSPPKAQPQTPPPGQSSPPATPQPIQLCSGGSAFLRDGVCVGFDPSTLPEGSGCTGKGPGGPRVPGVVRNGWCDTVGRAI